MLWEDNEDWTRNYVRRGHLLKDMGHLALIQRRLRHTDHLRGMSQRTSKHRKKEKQEIFDKCNFENQGPGLGPWLAMFHPVLRTTLWAKHHGLHFINEENEAQMKLLFQVAQSIWGKAGILPRSVWAQEHLHSSCIIPGLVYHHGFLRTEGTRWSFAPRST